MGDFPAMLDHQRVVIVHHHQGALFENGSIKTIQRHPALAMNYGDSIDLLFLHSDHRLKDGETT